MNAFDFIYPNNLKHLSGHLYSLIKTKLWLKVIIGMILGIGVGILLGPKINIVNQDTALTIGDWLALPGQIFLTLIQMIVVPLVFASVIRGITASDDLDKLKSMGMRIVLYFIMTTTVAITIGVLTAIIISPGSFIDINETNIVNENNQAIEESESVESLEISKIPDMIANILPENPFVSIVEQQMLQVVIFAVILGLALIAIKPEKAKPLIELLGALQEVCMTVVKWAMLLAPLAVFGLLARVTIKIGLDALIGMSAYVGTVLLALFFLLIFYILLVSIIGKKNPFKFLSKIREVQLLAFSTSSSAAVMPLSMKTAEDKLGINTSISQFLIPLGATINMDGTALYQGVATMFLAQVYGVDLGISALLLVIVTAVGASIGSPATPGVGIVILATVLSSVGIPASGIALIIGVDRILDMSRTTLNVTGDLTACTVMERLLESKSAESLK